MSKQPHTPSPWHYEGDHTHRQFNIYAPFAGRAGTKQTHVCTINNVPLHILSGRNPIEAEANARLIAAAPEMLEALEKVQSYLERSGESSLLDSFGVNSAIAKARGEA